MSSARATAVFDFAHSPFARWQIVEVTFIAVNTNQRVFHQLAPQDPRDVRYIPIRLRADAMVIDDNLQDTTYQTMPWMTDSIVLKSSAASTAELLLFIPRQLLGA